MATYAEILAASAHDGLRQKIRVAVVMAAETVRVEPEGTDKHIQRLQWAKAVFTNPELEGNKMVWPVLAQNASFTLTQITGATDAAVLSAVLAAINVIAS